MNNKGFILAKIMVVIGVVGAIISVILGVTSNVKVKVDVTNTIFEVCEVAYMEGQIDAIEGKLKITKLSNNYGDINWGWTSSPWDSGRLPARETYKEYKEARADLID